MAQCTVVRLMLVSKRLYLKDEIIIDFISKILSAIEVDKTLYSKPVQQANVGTLSMRQLQYC